MSAWTDFVKKYASEKGITYKNALKDKACGEAYRSHSKGEGLPKPIALEKEENITMSVKPARKPRGKKGLIAEAPSMEGEGIIVSAEGFEHIYPLTHDMIVKIAQRC